MPRLKIAIKTNKTLTPPAYKYFKISEERKTFIDWEVLVAHCLGWPVNSLPIAAIYAITDQLEGDKGSWLLVDPVELHLDGGYLMMLGHQHLQLNLQECQQLHRSLQTFLQQERIQFHCPENSKRWYFQSLTTQFIGGSSLRKILGKDIREGLPKSTQGQYERILLTQLQMLLNQHPINIARQEQELPPINSLWFWGGGSLVDLPATQNEPQKIQIWSNDCFTHTFARLQNLSTQILPLTLDSINTEADKIILLNAENETPGSLAELLQQMNILPLLQNPKIYNISEIDFYFSEPLECREQRWQKKTFLSRLPFMKKNKDTGCLHEKSTC